MSAPRSLPRLVAGAALALAAVLTIAAPASAHEDLASSDPAADAALATAPTEITLTFSAEVMTLGAVVVVADDSGADWADGEPVIREGTVVVPLREGMPDAGYEVRWRVVSADGHPISGLIPFTVGDAEPFTGASASSGGTSGTAAADSDSQVTQEGGIPRVALVGAIGAAAAAAAFALALFIMRRRAASASGAGPEAEPTGSGSRKENL